MGCTVGYPGTPCPFGHEGRVTRTSCGRCKNYKPPPHILAWCMKYDRDGVVCLLPKKACATCPDKHEHGAGRLPAADSRVDWTDPQSVRAYWREQAKRHPDARAAAMLRFLEKNPDYFAKYREANRDKMREASRRYYNKKREERNAKRAGEVRPDPRGPRSERDQDLPAPGSDDAV